jgi:hypothetical protein
VQIISYLDVREVSPVLRLRIFLVGSGFGLTWYWEMTLFEMLGMNKLCRTYISKTFFEQKVCDIFYYGHDLDLDFLKNRIWIRTQLDFTIKGAGFRRSRTLVLERLHCWFLESTACTAVFLLKANSIHLVILHCQFNFSSAFTSCCICTIRLNKKNGGFPLWP